VNEVEMQNVLPLVKVKVLELLEVSGFVHRPPENLPIQYFSDSAVSLTNGRSW
jgi:hypothetical protein